VEPLQPGGLDREEVGGQELLGMLAQEVGPGNAGPLGRGRQPSSPEDEPDRSIGAPPAQFAQFPLDAAITPTRILARQPNDQRLEFGRQLGPPLALAAPSEERPLPADQFPMPPEQSFGRDQERPPVWSRQVTAERRQQQAIRRLPAGSSHLPLQDAKLVAQSQYLQPQGLIGPSSDQQQVQDEAGKAVDQGQEHRSAIMPDSR